jgi:hypothetical protein
MTENFCAILSSPCDGHDAVVQQHYESRDSPN